MVSKLILPTHRGWLRPSIFPWYFPIEYSQRTQFIKQNVLQSLKIIMAQKSMYRFLSIETKTPTQPLTTILSTLFTNECRGRKHNYFLNGSIPASFCLFSFFSHYNFNTIWKKHRWCAWDSNLGLQDGRHRQNHGAMAATSENIILTIVLQPLIITHLRIIRLVIIVLTAS